MSIPTQRIAVFIDAENVCEWIKHGGIELLIPELNLLGKLLSGVLMVFGRAHNWQNIKQLSINRVLNSSIAIIRSTAKILQIFK